MQVVVRKVTALQGDRVTDLQAYYKFPRLRGIVSSPRDRGKGRMSMLEAGFNVRIHVMDQMDHLNKHVRSMPSCSCRSIHTKRPKTSE